MAIVLTRAVNRVDIDFDSGARKVHLDPNLNVSGFVGESDIYISTGPLDAQRSNVVLNFPVLRVAGRPNDNAPDVAEWLSDNFFSGNNYSATAPPGGDATAANQLTQIGLEGDIDASVQELIGKTPRKDIVVDHDSKEIVYHTSGSLTGKIDYIEYKTGGRFGTLVATKTLYYDGNDKIQYTEVT